MDKADALFRDLCENAHDLIQSVSPEGRFLYVNKAWLTTLGYTQDEVKDLLVHDVIHPDSREHCQQMMQQVMQGQAVAEIEATFVTKEGRSVIVEGSASCRFDDGKPVATRGLFRDVTESRRAEEELDKLFQLSPDLLCIAGTDGFFKRINPAFKAVFGYEHDELLSRQFVEFVHPDDRDKTLAEVARLAEGKPTKDFVNRYRAKDGKYRWLAWRAAPLAGEGLIYAVGRDISREKRDEARLARQAKELARSNADLEQFAYAASHDLRAPLRAIGNLARWIEEDLQKDDRGSVDQHVRQLQRRVTRLDRMIEDLLTYSRAGRGPGEVEQVDTAALVHEVIEVLAPAPGFRVRIEGEMPVLPTIRAPLEQVLRNLIGNALKHHDGETGQVTVRCRPAGRMVAFLVTDDGPGIPVEHQDEIFKMFHKLQARDRVEGSGIGLALVKRIVESFGGVIGLESERERGTTFRFTWPKKPRAAPRR